MRPGPPLLYVATAAGLGVATRSVVLHHPPSLHVALGGFFGYLAVVGAGVAFPRLEMWGDVLWRVPGGRGVALTFDDGPDPEHTPRVLRALARKKAKATFFCIGEKAERHPDVVRAIVAEGHEVGSHGFRIDRLLSVRRLPAVQADLERSVRVLERVTGVRPTLFRPPYGVLNPRFFRATDDLDLDVVGWSVRALDGVARTTAGDVVRRVVPGLRDGAIVCMHDAAERDDHVPVVADALPAIFDALEARRLTAVTVSALAASTGHAPGARA